eukprot:3687051-Pyramimonas_sp.AAC.1
MGASRNPQKDTFKRDLMTVTLRVVRVKTFEKITGGPAFVARSSILHRTQTQANASDCNE